MNIKRNSGFTLIELVIAAVIIGILSTVAIPKYFDYVKRTYRSDAYSGLTRMADLQERYYLQNRTYAIQEKILEVGGSGTTEGYYTLSIDSANVNGYVLRATANIGSPVEKDTGCLQLTLSSAQQMLPAGCWER